MPVQDRRVAGNRRPSPTRVLDHPTVDVQAILEVLGRRQPVDNERLINLANTNLAGAVLTKANLAGVYLRRANLTDASFYQANLTRAFLFRRT